ncbi:ATP-dependent nuclease [Carboxylicivirga sp. RSCT41]|uniref:ATP-dependent nuclease n=1 Tax=Carboxylicivirga agarovorans TaxID=3417570 RepID=UPI003D353279
MKISNIKIKNFKTFDNDGVELTSSSLTALVGENSVGKSNVLEALDVFFNFSKSKISIKSFHHNDYLNNIVIELKFIELSQNEKKIFKSHLDEHQELTIKQIISSVPKEEDIELKDASLEELDFVESKHGTKIQPTEEYDWAVLNEKVPTKKNLQRWWKSDLIVGGIDFKTFFDKVEQPTQEEYQEKLINLWEEHDDIIPTESISGDEKMLGWKSKLKANLPKYFYIPAIKNLSDDLKVTSSSPLGEMVKWLSKSVSKEIKEEFKTKSEKLISELISEIDKGANGESKIKSLNTALNTNIGFDIGCELELRFGSPGIEEVVFPEPKIFANDGYDSELTQKGHGIQRLTIFSLLRTYNTFQFDETKKQRNIIIGIEEPEIYLHPPVKRSTYKLLRQISETNDQVFYTTHDNYFVSVEHFEEIKLFRKSNENSPKTFVYGLTIGQIQSFYKKKYEIDIDKESLKDRFNHIIDESKNEGFFAKKIILIEGETEKYALPNYFQALGFDIDMNRIALISAGSVDNISYLYLLFNEFHIPCYAIFDGDRPDVFSLDSLFGDKKQDAKRKSKRNKELYSLLGLKSSDNQYFFPETCIGDNHSVWNQDFECEFHIPLANYSELKSQAKKLYGNNSKPLTAKYISEKVSDNLNGEVRIKVEGLISKVNELKWKSSILE